MKISELDIKKYSRVHGLGCKGILIPDIASHKMEIDTSILVRCTKCYRLYDMDKDSKGRQQVGWSYEKLYSINKKINKLIEKCNLFNDEIRDIVEELDDNV